MPSLTHRWRTHSIEKLGISFDVVEGAEVREGQAGELAYLQQDLQHDKPVAIAMWSGKDTTLAWWRGRFGGRRAVLGPETVTTICGRPGARQEVSVPEERATGAFRGSDGRIGHIPHRVPPQVHVAVAGTTPTGTPFVVTWVVDAGQRDALRADEDHFLASIRCM